MGWQWDEAVAGQKATLAKAEGTYDSQKEKLPTPVPDTGGGYGAFATPGGTAAMGAQATPGGLTALGANSVFANTPSKQDGVKTIQVDDSITKKPF